MFHRVDDRLVHSVTFGAGDSTLVGVPGSIASWEIWAPVFESLSASHRVIAFDHDGVGQSKVPVEHITQQRRLQALFAVLDDLDVERCVIAGDSNNGCLAIEAVLEQPHRFDGLVVVSGHAWGFDYPAARQFVSGLRHDFAGTVDFFVELVFPEPDSDHLKAWLRDIIRQTGPDASAAIVESYFGIDLRDRLAQVVVPAKVIFGGLDTIGPHALDRAGELASLLRAELDVIDDAGHLPLLSRPEAVAASLDAFVNRLAGS